MSESDSSPDSLLAPAGAPDGETPAAAPDGGESTWFWAEDQPGAGDRPEWLKGEKYKSVADQAKAYTELEGKLGSFTGAPDDYEIPDSSVFADSIQLPEGVDFNLDKEDPLLQSFSEQAKEMGINQEGFNKLVGLYVQQQANDYADTMTNADTEREQLGPNAADRLQNVDQWAKANLDSEIYNKVVGLATTADAVEAIEALIAKTRNASLPDPSAVTPRPATSKSEIDEMMAAKDESGQLKYITDKAYRSKVERLFKQQYGEEPYRQTIGG